MVSRTNRNQLFTITVVGGFLCLVSIDGNTLETVSTRPFSVVTKDDCHRSVISSIGLSPDSAVVFFLDKGLSSLIRMEIDSGHCRSFGYERCCKYIYKTVKIFITRKTLFIADAIGLSFTSDSVLLHHHYQTVVMTTMGLRVTTKTREQCSLRAASSPEYVVTAR